MKYICIITCLFIFIPVLVMGQDFEENTYLSNSSSVNKQPVKSKNIDLFSVQSLYLIPTKGNKELGTATGFIVERNNTYYLITNWHVLSGRHPLTNETIYPSGDIPSEVLIWHNGNKLATWVQRREVLYNSNGNKRWLEHKLKQKVDIVALPLQSVDKNLKIYPFKLSLAENDMKVSVSMSVSIIGFPFGFKGPGFLPIWKTGHIASEPEIDYNNEPLFIIDATTRPGMSGSPVVLRQYGGYMDTSGDYQLKPGTFTRFLGVYSGRLSKDSELGRVWRPRLIQEILDQH